MPLPWAEGVLAQGALHMTRRSASHPVYNSWLRWMLCVRVWTCLRAFGGTHMPRLAQILLLLLTGACHCRMENMHRAVRTWQPLLKRRAATLFRSNLPSRAASAAHSVGIEGVGHQHSGGGLVLSLCAQTRVKA